MGTRESSAVVSSFARSPGGVGVVLWASLALSAAASGCDGEDSGADASADVVAEAAVDVQRAADAAPVDATASDVADATASNVADATASDVVDAAASDVVDATASDVVDATASDVVDATASDAVDAASDGGARDVVDVMLVNGCPAWRDPVASPGDAPGDDRYATYARGFFDRYCVRCHASTLRTAEARMGAPTGFDWDLETSIRMQLMRIRAAVGVDNYMPLTAPNPTCDERRRLVRWIDLGAP